MKTIKLTLKGIMLYATMLTTMVYIAGIDSIYDNGHFLLATSIVALPIYICYKTITGEEFNILSGNKLWGIPDDES
jgi:hypothetical protein